MTVAGILSVLRKGAPLAVSTLLVFWVLRTVDLADLLGSIAQVPSFAVAVILLLLAANVPVICFRLWRLLRQFGRTIPFLDAVRATVAGLVSSLFVFSLIGAILGRQAALRRSGIGVPTIALITTYERLVLAAVGGGFFLIGGGLLFGREMMVERLPDVPIAAMALTILLAGALFHWISPRTVGRSAVGRLFQRVTVTRVAETAAVSAVSQVLTFTAYVVALSALGVEAGTIELFAAAAIVTFAASLPISVNGWGVREVAAIFTFGALGLPETEAAGVSVLVGLCSSLVVSVSAMVLWRRRADAEFDTENASDSSAVKTDRLVPFILALAIGSLLFFQIYLHVGGSLISVNLADPFAVIALTVLVLSWAVSGRAPISLPPMVWIWLIGLTAMIAVGFLIGVARFGVTPWALGNRLVGWVVLMGYAGAGAMLVAAWGRHGLRRLMDAIIATAVAVSLTTMITFLLYSAFGIDVLLDYNFQGFSGNRNTFAFQLVVAISAVMVFSSLRSTPQRKVFWACVLAILMASLWNTSSKTGMVVGVVLLTAGFALRVGDRKVTAGAAAICVCAYALTFAISMLVPTDDTGLQNMFSRIQTPTTVAIGGVIERWQSLHGAFYMWLEAPIFGAGLGAFVQQGIAAGGGGALVIHSSPVWLLAEFGVVGLVVAAWLPVYGAVWAVRRLGSWHRPALALAICLVAAFGAFSLLHDVFYQRIFWLVGGACVAGVLISRPRRPQVQWDDGRPLTVMHVITTLNRGGAETMLLGLMRQRDPSIRPIVVSLLPDGALANAFRETGVRVVELGLRRGAPNLSGVFRLARLIRQERPTLIQGWMYHGDLLALLGLYLSGRRSETTLVWGIRCSDMDFSRYSWQLRMVVRLCAALSGLPDAVIANSEAGRSVHRTLGYNPRRFEMVHNGIDLGAFHPNAADRGSMRAELGLPSDARVLVCVARVDPQKDHDRLIEAVGAIPDLYLVLVGRGTDALPAHPRILALGQRGDIPRILCAADGYVSASAFGEGFSNALAEGVAAGLAPIATDVGDSAAIVGHVGWLIPPGDTTALIDALNSFVSLSDDAMATRQQSARNHALSHFDLPAAAGRFKAVYRDLLSGSVPPQPTPERP